MTGFLKKVGGFLLRTPLPPGGGAFPKWGVANFGREDGGQGSGAGGARAQISVGDAKKVVGLGLGWVFRQNFVGFG